MISVVGGSLAALVACERLLNEGFHIKHHVSSTAHLGGHFAGVDFLGKFVDIGMVLVEPRIAIPPKTIDEFTGETGSDLNAYSHLALDWLLTRTSCLSTIPIVSILDNSQYNDFMIADSLDVILAQDPEIQNQIKRELANAMFRSQHHPREKKHDPWFLNPVDLVFSEMYGPTFAEFLESMAQKIGGTAWSSLVAAAHRQLWLPLYYPESLFESLEVGSSVIPPLEFQAPVEGGVARIVRELEFELKRHPRYDCVLHSDEVIRESSVCNKKIDPASSFEVRFVDQKKYQTFDASNIAVPIAIALCSVRQVQNRRVIHSLDPESAWFRAAIGLSDSKTIAVELGRVLETESHLDLLYRLKRCLDDLELEMDHSAEVFRLNVLIPSFGAKNAECDVPKSCIVRNPNGLIATTYADAKSLSSQIVLGLKCSTTAKEFANE